MRSLRTLIALAFVLLVGVAPAAAQTSVKTVDAKIVDFDFQPKTLEVDVGSTVVWSNTGARPHTVTDRGGTFDSNPIAPGEKSSISFSVPGIYAYFCRINPSKMNGTIVVKPGATPARVNRIQALDPGREGESLRFDPNTLTVQQGSTIVFANVGGKPHTLTADDGAFDSGVVTPGAEGGRFAGTNASVVLRKAGTFAFHCEVHPAAMKGTLTVTPGSGGAADTGPAAASSAPRSVSVDMGDLFFKPPQISVAPGGKVTWTNKGQAPHDAKFDDVELQTQTLKNGQSASLTMPDKPGSYSYLCSIHPAKMRAVIVVVGQNTADPTKAVAAAPAAAVGGGPGGGISTFVLATAIIAAFLGGAGLAAFVRNRPAAAS
jgi:plastocyanin